MKPQKHFSALLFMIALVISCSENNNQEKLKTIPYYSDKVSINDIRSHKNGDVEIYRIMGVHGEGYAFNFWVDHSGKLIKHGAAWHGNEGFDKMSYHWQNEKSIFIKLVNSQTGYVDSLALIAQNGGATTMVTFD